MSIAAMMAELVTLEEQVSDEAAEAVAADRLRVYEWRPSKIPELPALWNWIDDGSVEVPDTARVDDVIVVTATIAVRPADSAETIGRLVRLSDVFRTVVDPALKTRPVLGGTVRRARRIVTRTSFDEFSDVPVMCMDMLIRVELAEIYGGG